MADESIQVLSRENGRPLHQRHSVKKTNIKSMKVADNLVKGTL